MVGNSCYLTAVSEIHTCGTMHLLPGMVWRCELAWNPCQDAIAQVGVDGITGLSVYAEMVVSDIFVHRYVRQAAFSD